MAITHNLPPLKDDLYTEFREAPANVSTASVLKFFRYKILEPENVVVVEFCGTIWDHLRSGDHLRACTVVT